jgi:uncharacterized Zn finger protein (UPF0148 family)
MSETERDTTRCPICESLLELDEDGAYFCPHCGWDESADPEENEVWIVPDRGGE